jgi:ATP:ADP antiporter, AAA family
VNARSLGLPMAASALAVATLTVAKAARDTLFVATFPVAWLPYAFIATGIATALFISIYTRVVARLSLRRAVPFFAGAFALLFAVSAVAATQSRSPKLIGVIYLVLSIGATSTVGGFWSLFSDTIDVKSARRSLGTLTMMASIGGFAGALLSSGALMFAGERMLLPIVAALCAIAAFLLFRMSRGSSDVPSQVIPSTTEARAGLREGMKAIATTPYLKHVALFVLTTAIAGTLGDYVMKSSAAKVLPNEAAMAQFFLTFHGVVAGFTLAAQLLLAQPMLEKRGLAATLAVLPSFLCVGALSLAMLPTAAIAAGVRGGETAIRNSTHKAAFELVFVPVSTELKRKARAIFDTLLDRVADGAGAVLLIALIYAGDEPRAFAVVMGFLGLFAALTVRAIRRGYVESLTTRLASNDDDDPEMDPAILSEIVARETIHQTLAQLDAGARERLSKTSFGAALGQANTLRVASGTLVAARADAVSDEPLSIALWRAIDSKAESSTVRRLIDRWSGRDRRSLSGLIELLADDRHAGHAQKKLIAHVEHHHGALSDVLLDSEADLQTRVRVTRILGESRSPLVVAPLIASLNDPQLDLRYRAGRALRAIAQAGASLDSKSLWQVIEREVTDGPILRRVQDGETDPLRHVFNLLALTLEARAVDLSYEALRGEDEARRALALEYLDNVLPQEVRKKLLRRLGEDAPVDPAPSRSVAAIVAELDPEAELAMQLSRDP